MDIFDYGIGIIILILIMVIVVEFFVVWTVSSYLATYLGATGIVWWCISIVAFMVINGLLGVLGRVV